MAHVLDPQVLELLVERVTFVLARLPAAVDAERVFAEPDAHPLQLQDPALARALGWIEGLADAVDLRELELLDEADIVVDSIPQPR